MKLFIRVYYEGILAVAAPPLCLKWAGGATLQKNFTNFTTFTKGLNPNDFCGEVYGNCGEVGEVSNYYNVTSFLNPEKQDFWRGGCLSLGPLDLAYEEPDLGPRKAGQSLP